MGANRFAAAFPRLTRESVRHAGRGRPVLVKGMPWYSAIQNAGLIEICVSAARYRAAVTGKAMPAGRVCTKAQRPAMAAANVAEVGCKAGRKTSCKTASKTTCKRPVKRMRE